MASPGAQPAASLILMRERRAAPPEILVVRRSESLVFAAGAYVFPGGRVDPGDVAAASARYGAGADAVADAAARIAALRETHEETGIAAAARVADLIPFARWRAPAEAPRRFDTRFFLAPAVDDAADPVADGIESSAAFWASAQAVLDDCATGRGHAIFPTRRLLERLAQFGSFAEARDQALRLPGRIIEPWIEQRQDGAWLCIPPDAGYPVTAELLARTARF